MLPSIHSADAKGRPQNTEIDNGNSNFNRAFSAATDEGILILVGSLPKSRPLALAIVLGLCAPQSSLAVTQYVPKRLPFQFDITSLTTKLDLPVKDDVETIKMSAATMQERTERASNDETIEPLTVVLGDKDASVSSLAEKIAQDGKAEALAAILRYQFEKSQAPKSSTESPSTRTVSISKAAFDLLNLEAFSELYSRQHHNLMLDSGYLAKNSQLRRELIQQIGPYFRRQEREALQSKINQGKPLTVDADLLPEFARKMVKKFINYRGPNCFHAALAFQSPKLTGSSLINVKTEQGYHRAMINYDELWRALTSEFYEVNPEQQPLKYGDILVLFDVPEESSEDLNVPVHFSWIRHTATYLFSGYTFSKGSKSPNTPYIVRTVAEEWKTWKHFTKNLALKVYRRSNKSPQSRPPMDLTDWIY